MLSAIPQPGEVYRFRSVDALIGPRKELYRQTIYLARPDELNDLAEDTVNVVWSGDEVLWSNLITYYWRSILLSMLTGYLYLPGYHIHDYRRLENTELSVAVEDQVAHLLERYSTQKAEILAELSQRQAPVSYFEVRGILLKLTPTEYDNRFLRPAKLPPSDDFPSRFVQGMGKTLLGEWRVACFTDDFTNPFLWSMYGEDHAGVCLIFNRESLRNIRSPGHWDIELEDISYQDEKPEIEFWENIPRMTVPELKKLLEDENGVLSPLCRVNPEEKGEVRKAIEEQIDVINRNDLLTKTKRWEGEKEVRMFCQIYMRDDDDLDPAKYTVQYPIEALKGVIFGRRTTQEHRQAILDVILAKHYVSPMGEDFWFMEADPQPDGSVRKRPYSPYVGWQHKFVYPKER